MPKEVFGAGYHFLPREKLMTFEEIARLTRVFVQLGVSKVRLTGGEPLLRKDLAKLVAMLAKIPGVKDLAMTTNGALLKQHAGDLKAAGLHRMTVSLDALDAEIFAKMNGTEFAVGRVLEGIAAAKAAGFGPVKINAVIQRGVNESEIIPLAKRFSEAGDIVRFIEYMDVGNTNAWQRPEVVSGAEIIQILSKEFELEPTHPSYRSEVARRYVDAKSGGEIGVITSVTQPFCVNCSRARISSDGKLFTCLFSNDGFDLLTLLRATTEEQYLYEAIGQRWAKRDDRYSELRGASGGSTPKIEMSAIGG
jgi:cyclic pyranopterin phosphate synthase